MEGDGYILSEQSEYYSITMKATSSKELRLILDKNMRILEVTNRSVILLCCCCYCCLLLLLLLNFSCSQNCRPVRWVSASLISTDSDVSRCCVFCILNKYFVLIFIFVCCWFSFLFFFLFICVLIKLICKFNS